MSAKMYASLRGALILLSVDSPTGDGAVPHARGSLLVRNFATSFSGNRQTALGKHDYIRRPKTGKRLSSIHCYELCLGTRPTPLTLMDEIRSVIVSANASSATIPLIKHYDP